MDKSKKVIDLYVSKIRQLESRRKRLNGIRSWIAAARFLIVVATISGFFFNRAGSWESQALLVGIGLITFVFLVSRSVDLKNQVDNIERLIQVNQHEVNVLNNDFLAYEGGAEFMPSSHEYANDIDLFGHASLYQYISRCTAEQAKSLLSHRLMNALPQEEIAAQQQAVAELAVRVDWKQQFLSYGKANPVTKQMEDRIVKWMNRPGDPYKASFWKIVANLYPVFSVATVGLFLGNIIHYRLFFVVVILFYIFSLYISKTLNKSYLTLSGIYSEVQTLYDQIHWFEKEEFTSVKINSIKRSLSSEPMCSASKEIHRLKRILNLFDMRLNVFFFLVLNTFFLWDLRQMIALNKWKSDNSSIVPQWFAALAEIEVLISISSLVSNEPQWPFPEVTGRYFTLDASDIGHPLIEREKRITNSISLIGEGKVALITGSNMAGKSTFLRSIAVNLVLAQMGAPVCARFFTFSPVKLMSSMRIADNLSESTSTFQEELKKLKLIINAVNNQEKIFILLDEILRGTNSLDRHTGSIALAAQLTKRKVVAVIATHDVELAKLTNTYGHAVSNYHFDAQVSGGEISFDYKLREGVCQSLNASILMKKIGIEI